MRLKLIPIAGTALLTCLWLVPDVERSRARTPAAAPEARNSISASFRSPTNPAAAPRLAAESSEIAQESIAEFRDRADRSAMRAARLAALLGVGAHPPPGEVVFELEHLLRACRSGDERTRTRITEVDAEIQFEWDLAEGVLGCEVSTTNNFYVWVWWCATERDSEGNAGTFVRMDFDDNWIWYRDVSFEPEFEDWQPTRRPTQRWGEDAGFVQPEVLFERLRALAARAQ